ncbi:MAG: hypothetical protein Q8N48_02650 [Thiobacillus sp.]|nr:hypothetical protein [Thiobacillus sp.]MDP2253674.1 hypothetical protein [Thiobacillus sp.]MDP2977709.1 hypothetical protein [Thiobacillus sp.]
MSGSVAVLRAELPKAEAEAGKRRAIVVSGRMSQGFRVLKNARTGLDSM